ncbi:rhomboid family intramembrane serine protease [Tropicimonas sp. IMCC34043]|uniref:rhomboid family intramembrane serine protease n=1 Tax=Tropicimonas sp. IMCC34043 TaxID=2248760 RepID=UPI000E24D6FB|nr:rhomboid family intramembrane serine protease [Tropicimonas sp. IMCC34043]
MAHGDEQNQTTEAAGNAILSALIVTCIAIEAALSLSDFGLLPWPRLRYVFYEYGAFWPGLLQNWRPAFPWQPWTMFLTYGFLHGGLLHLAFNMITLRSLGRVVIARIGALGFVAIYVTSMICGAGVYGMLAADNVPMVGASGALFGLAGALVGWAWTAQSDTMASIRATWQLIAFLIGINLVMYFSFSTGVAWQTHLGGFVVGWAVALLLDRFDVA